MAEYIAREEVKRIICEICGECDGDVDVCEFRDIKVDAITTDNLRTVILCKDCRHRDPEDHKCDCGEMERQGCPFKVADDYFCAYGEES